MDTFNTLRYSERCGLSYCQRFIACTLHVYGSCSSFFYVITENSQKIENKHI